jgi:hypothetical protein
VFAEVAIPTEELEILREPELDNARVPTDASDSIASGMMRPLVAMPVPFGVVNGQKPLVRLATAGANPAIVREHDIPRLPTPPAVAGPVALVD